jgi:hypothetical protein
LGALLDLGHFLGRERRERQYLELMELEQVLGALPPALLEVVWISDLVTLGHSTLAGLELGISQLQAARAPRVESTGDLWMLGLQPLQ